MRGDDLQSRIMALTSQIVAAHVAHNATKLEELPGLIERVYNSLVLAGRERTQRLGRPQPAVPIRKSVTPEYLVCLEDGKRLKMLKRHLMTAYSMSPEDYRERWSLPPDYPMVAPNYARQRSRLAKEIGLGTRGRRLRAR